MKIAELIGKLDYHFNTLAGEVIMDHDRVRALRGTEVSGIVNDSRKISKDCLFFCIVGAVRDGHEFARQALLDGAAALVVQKDLDLSDLEGKTPVKEPVIIRVQDTRYAMAYIAAAYYGNPASRMKIIGVTGTKGKTTTTYMVKSILEAAGFKVGLIGTIEILYGDVRIPAHNTTPESTPDHIGPNEHKDFDDYLQCKSLLFRQCRVGIFNADDKYYKKVMDGHTCSVETYGLSPEADLHAENLQLIKKPGELGVEFDVKGLMDFHAEVPAPGRFSVYNALCAIAVCRHFNVTPEDVRKALLKVHVRGRIEMVKVSDDFTLMIDYAHNAMALESLLATLREYEPHRLVCLFGCGGNRSKLRRFEMGEVSGKLAELSIITSDNPRDEEPMAIIEDIVTGISRTDGKYVTIPDRKEAIRYAIRNGEPGDIVVLAGKGHEDYQEIKGHKYPMDERVLIREILEEG